MEAAQLMQPTHHHRPTQDQHEARYELMQPMHHYRPIQDHRQAYELLQPAVRAAGCSLVLLFSAVV